MNALNITLRKDKPVSLPMRATRATSGIIVAENDQGVMTVAHLYWPETVIALSTQLWRPTAFQLLAHANKMDVLVVPPCPKNIHPTIWNNLEMSLIQETWLFNSWVLTNETVLYIKMLKLNYFARFTAMTR